MTAMTDDENGKNTKNTKIPKIPKQSSAMNSRDARLAAALRENLHRRKAQERARGAEERERSGPSEGGGVKPSPGGENV